jgi:tetratricopeptide (TPR) repeat protein
LDPFVVSGDRVSWVLFQAHRYDDAIRESHSALAIQPNNAVNLMDLGFALIADNKAPDAIPVLEKAVTLSPAALLRPAYWTERMPTRGVAAMRSGCSRN